MKMRKSFPFPNDPNQAAAQNSEKTKAQLRLLRKAMELESSGHKTA